MRLDIQKSHAAAQRFHLLIGQGNRLSSDANNGMDTGGLKDSHSVLTGGFYENVTREQWPLNRNVQPVFPMADCAVNGKKKIDVSCGELLGYSFLLARMCIRSKPLGHEIWGRHLYSLSRGLEADSTESSAIAT